uniref:hypothetical protein n=1 Tax=Bacillus sp. X1(2014) TaxID=1565991 RepID=UPI001C92D058
ILSFFTSKQLEAHFQPIKLHPLSTPQHYHNQNQTLPNTFHLFPPISKAIPQIPPTPDYNLYPHKITEQQTQNPTTIPHLVHL